ncbi:MAG: hypothetical protein R3D68_10550 [Hyphomicrobiaceae bacterium]
MSKHVIAIAVLLAVSGVPAAAQFAPPRDYVFKPAAPCIEDKVRAAKPVRPSDARYAVCEDQMALLAKALAEAKASGKLLLVTFGATWCPWCASLQRTLPGAALLGHKDTTLDYGAAFHHAEIGLSMVWKGKKAEIPSGEATLKHVLAMAPGVKIRAIPFMAVLDPAKPGRVFARNTDDVAKADGSHDTAKFRALLLEARAYLAGEGSGPSEPNWFVRKWRRFWNG